MTTDSSTVRYPALYECATKEYHAINGADVFVVGRSQAADLPLLDVQCSRQQFQLVKRSGGYGIEALSVNSKTFCNDREISDVQPLLHGTVIRSGRSHFFFLEREDPSVQEQFSLSRVQDQATIVPKSIDANNRDQTIVGDSQHSGEMQIDRPIGLSGQMLIGRDAGRVAIHLNHSQISRVHAQIDQQNQTATVVDLNSANGTFVNGRKITAPTLIRPGDRIDIGPFALAYDGKSLSPQSRSNNVELACRNLVRKVKSRDTGNEQIILDDVTLVIEPREFVCLLGPSGSGKSTLLSALSARVPSDAGQVSINGEDLYTNFDALKCDIAVVPQKDIMHDLLNLKTALGYTARLRLPPDTSNAEISQAVDDMLNIVNLTNRGGSQIRYLSGGQTKRASLANEIINKPSLLFLDEVTSGLDEETDAEMMRLFRRLANRGKTVVCITHNLTHVEQSCHRVVILTEGGKLAFYGTPDEAKSYFEVDRLGAVYSKLASRPAQEWKEAFEGHELYQRQIANKLRPESQVKSGAGIRPVLSISDWVKLFSRQTKLLLSRYAKIQMADRNSLAMMCGQCVLVALMICLLFGDISEEYAQKKALYASKIMFLLSVSALWLGCNNAAKEIVKEREIYTKEQDVNLLPASYLNSKVLLLGGVSLLQVIALFIIVKVGIGVPAGLGAFLILATLAFAGVSLGLLISVCSKSTDMAVTIVPLVLIPQIILAGAISEVSGWAELISELFVVSYWGYGGMVAALPEEVLDWTGYEDWSAFASWFIVMLHAAVYLGAAILILLLAGSRDNAYRNELDKRLRQSREGLSRTLQAVQQRHAGGSN